MRRPRVGRRFASMGLLLGTLAWAPAARGASEPEVDGAVQVTNNPNGVRGHATPVVAVSPEDDRVIALAEGDAYSSRCAVHVSTDGGLGWTQASAPVLPEPWSGCMFSTTGEIADIVFAEDGTLYYALSGFDPETYHQRVFLTSSTDLGQTWDTTTALPWIEPDLEAGEFGADALPSLAVDPDNLDRVYVAWWSNNGAWNLTEGAAQGQEWCDQLVPRPWVAVSEDGGASFSEPVDMAPGVDGCMTEPYLVTGNDGELYAFFGEESNTDDNGAAPPPANLYLSVSRDGGSTFEVRSIHAQSGPEKPEDPEEPGSDWLSAPSPGIDRRTGDLYVAWEEMGEGTPQILFMRSGDDGRTWGDPIKLNRVDPKRDWDFTEMFPTLSVGPEGRIDVAWYDWRNDTTFTEDAEEGGLQDVYFTSSVDGGTTWSPDRPVNDRMIDRRFGARSTGFITGPIGLAATEHVTYVAWDDTRNGNPDTGTQDIYATRVRFGPPGQVFGEDGGDLSGPIWALLGAAATLVAVGLALLLRTRRPDFGSRA